MEHYENFEQTSDEIVESESVIREDRKNKLRKLAYNQGLQQETYYLINKQFKKELTLHPPKYMIINQKVIQVLMINEPVHLGRIYE
jgi:ribosomal protein S6